ncbi:MAG: hypothetical protein PHN56_00005, partial [Candidatus Nanoarchaeia archaeon]|nr:hypothetical protein [Candidatus Nanoarchaeia archaeon]
GISLKNCLETIAEKKEIIDLLIDNYKRFNDDFLLSNEVIVTISSMIGSGKKFSDVSKYVKSLFLKGNENEIIISILKSFKAYSKDSAVDSKEIYNKLENVSRPKFNELLSSLESKKIIEGFSKSHKRYWFIRR